MRLLVPDELCGLCLMVWVWVQQLLEVQQELPRVPSCALSESPFLHLEHDLCTHPEDRAGTSVPHGEHVSPCSVAADYMLNGNWLFECFSAGCKATDGLRPQITDTECQWQ